MFCKLDAKVGYWSIRLDEESQILSTFHTPFDRDCWRRFPFGLSMSQDFFQAKMDQILKKGLHQKMSSAKQMTLQYVELTRISLMERAVETGLMFNSDKMYHRAAEHILLWKPVHRQRHQTRPGQRTTFIDS